MTEIKRPQNLHDSYHAHVYFNAQTLEFASELCERATALFDLKMGRVHQKSVGPHPCWSCQISFTNKDFEALIAWLDEHRNDLSILVHGQTGNDLKDHTDYAYWLGDDVPLKLAMFGG